MEQNVDLNAISKDLAFLKKAVIEMQLAMKNSDVCLSREDSLAVDEYLEDKAKGYLISHDELEKELGL